MSYVIVPTYQGILDTKFVFIYIMGLFPGGPTEWDDPEPSANITPFQVTWYTVPEEPYLLTWNTRHRQEPYTMKIGC